MNIALIGSGGREHVLCQKIYESKLSKNIVCIPGNAGTAKVAKNIDLNFLDFRKLLKTLKLHKIDLVIVGPEEPLVKGIVDFLNKNKIKVFGPNKYAARLEGSKAFMKSICKKYKIPTAEFKTCKNKKDVINFLKKTKFPLVVKADGLAAGKGVTICKTKKEVLNVSNEIFQGKFKTSKKLVLEEFLDGEEASYFLIVDKKSYKFFGSAQDHKRVGENEKGPNTGGMGAYSPAPIINKNLERKIISKIVRPTLQALKNKKKPYTGFLYVGLMIINNEPYLIEYNVRMGDPECQTILPKLKNDLLDVVLACVNQKLDSLDLEWYDDKSLCIVLCSKGYPDQFQNNIEIENLDKMKLLNNEFIFHAGTKLDNGKIFSNGGRVLNFVIRSENFKNSRDRGLQLINELDWKNGFYRKDIGFKVID